MCHKNLFTWVFCYGVYNFYWRQNYKNTEFWVLLGVSYTVNPSSIYIMTTLASSSILSLLSSPTSAQPNQ